MYKIGDFAVISRVSIKMLRHYDEIGLLKPAEVDRFTGYRFYTLDQLPRLNRIMALKSMGFGLAEIRELVNQHQPLSAEDLLAQAAAKEAALQSELHAVHQKLAHLKTWMRRIELENAMPAYEIVLKPLESTAVSPVLIPTEQPLTLPLPNLAGLPDDVLIPRDQLRLPNALACTVHSGGVDDLVQAYRALDAWIKAQGYTIAGTPHEIMLKPAEKVNESVDDESETVVVIEVQLPIFIAQPSHQDSDKTP